MTIGLVVIDCIIDESRSLKAKRRVLSSIIERLRRRFNVAICEFDHQNKWQRSRLAVVVVNTSWPMAQRTMSMIVDYFERNRQVSVLDAETRRLC